MQMGKQLAADTSSACTASHFSAMCMHARAADIAVLRPFFAQGLLHLYNNISKIRWDSECAGATLRNMPRMAHHQGPLPEMKPFFLPAPSEHCDARLVFLHAFLPISSQTRLAGKASSSPSSTSLIRLHANSTFRPRCPHPLYVPR